jgi:hypothetical protein
MAELPKDIRPQNRRCLFTLHGHLDYIRTVQFHHEMPWIVCACFPIPRTSLTENTPSHRSQLPMTRPSESGTAPQGTV